MKHIYLLIIIIMIIQSCEKDEDNKELCKDVDMGTYTLLTESKSSYPYNNIQKIYFKDSSGNVVVFHTEDNLSDSLLTVTREDSCESDKTQLVEYTAEVETNGTKLKNDSLKIHYTVMLSAETYILSDWLRVFKNGSGILEIIVSQRDLNNEYFEYYGTVPVATKTLLDKEFQDVYINDAYTLLYNYEFGIVGFKDNENKLWVFERME